LPAGGHDFRFGLNTDLFKVGIARRERASGTDGDGVNVGAFTLKDIAEIGHEFFGANRGGPHAGGLKLGLAEGTLDAVIPKWFSHRSLQRKMILAFGLKKPANAGREVSYQLFITQLFGRIENKLRKRSYFSLNF
jgi:hypothetical protein